MLLDEIQLKGLKIHLAAYQLGDIIEPAEKALENIAASGKSDVSSGTFLNSASALTFTLIKNGNSFLFWIAAATPPRPLAAHFPQMLPYSPWGVIDIEPFPFPHLAAVEINGTNWDYLYIFAEDANPKTRDGLTSALDAELFDKLNAEIRLLAKATGGLYFRGGAALSSETMISSVSMLAHLIPAQLTDAVAGYVSFRGLLPELRLQVPLFSKTGRDLGFSSIDTVSLSLEIASPLSGLGGQQLAGSRRVGVIGHLKIDKVDLVLAGSWPLDDDDDVQLSLRCSTSQINTWFANSSLAGLPWPSAPVDAEVALVVSKNSGKLEKASFTFVITDWVVSSDQFPLTLQEVKLAVTVYSPASLRLMGAGFAAKAKVGTMPLLCTGNYPDGDFYLGLDPQTTTPVYLNDLVDALGMNGSGMPRFPASLALTELSGEYNSGTGYKAFRVAVAEAPNWDTGSADSLGFNLTDLSLGIYGASTYVFKLKAAFLYAFKKVPNLEVKFAGTAEYNAGWTFNLSYAATTHVSLSDIGTEFGFEAPSQLNAFNFKELGFGADIAAEQKYFHGKGSVTLFGSEVDIDLLVNKTSLVTEFSGSFTFVANVGEKAALFTISSKSGKESQLELKTIFTVAGVEIYLDAKSETPTTPPGPEKNLSEKHFVGGTQGLTLPISDLLNGLMDIAGMHIPDEFNPDINLEDIYISYNGATKQTDLIALSSVDGQEIQLFFQYRAAVGDKPKQYAFGINTDIKTLGGLPLVGSQLKDFKLSGIGFVYVSSAGKFTLPVLSGSAANEDVRTIDFAAGVEKSYAAGINFTGAVGLPFMENPLALALPLGEQKTPASTAVSTVPKTGAAKQPAANDGTKWFELDKKIGPLQLKKVGLAYADNRLYLLISLELGLAGMGVSLEGLGVGFDPKELLKGHFDPDFKLAGLDLSYSKPGLTIEGAIIRLSADQLQKANEKLVASSPIKFQFDGALIVQAETWGLSAVASYAQLENGTISLFIFVDINDPLGGPPFFFVEGLMGGFGINRTLRIPTFEHVRDFPLLAMGAPAQGSAQDQAMATLQALEGGDNPWISTREGDYWLAVGVKFSSFEFVHGQLLLIAEFGHELKFTVLGLAQLVLPLPSIPSAEEGPRPFVFLELQMAAVLAPDEGYFSVAASLTADSYVLTKDCHITGGFAYSMWYGNNPHAGDFVMTAGGYHPAFRVPDHYPQVARLGYNWQVSDNVRITGASYFAVTPSCGMAGTSLEVLFEAGDIKVWFIARADMLVTWHPLSFIAEIDVELGASIRLNLLFCHKTITISLSASLTLWGPPLGGRVRVHVVIVTITIGFGSDNALGKNHQALPWEEFKSLLPKANDLCKIVASSGLTQMLKAKPAAPDEKDVWVVRAGTFGFTAQSAIPVSSLTYGTDGKQVILGNPVNIRPMNAAHVDSVFNLRISREKDSPDIYGVADEWRVTADKGNVELVRGGVPPALWGIPLIEDGQFVQAPATPSNDVLNDQVLGCYVKAPDAKAGATFGIIALKELEYEEVAVGRNPLSAAPTPTLTNYQAVATEPWTNPETKQQETRAQHLDKGTLKATSVNRNGLFGVLSAAKLLYTADADTLLDPTKDATLPKLAAQYESLFTEAPLLFA